MEHIFLVDPIGKLPDKLVCLKRLSSLTGWDFLTGLFRSIHIFLGVPSSSRPFTIYFRSCGKWKARAPNGIFQSKFLRSICTDAEANDDFITSCLTDKDFEDKLKPEDIKLSSAMAMSAAAVSPHLGKHEDAERRYAHFFTVFDIEIATKIVYNMTGERGNSRQDIFGQVRL